MHGVYLEHMFHALYTIKLYPYSLGRHVQLILFYQAGLFFLVGLVLFLDEMRERELVSLQYVIHAGGNGSR